MKFKLYYVDLIIWEVNQSYDSDAEIENKFLLISTPNDNYRNRSRDKFHFDFERDNIYTNYTKEKLNTKIIIHHSDGKGKSELFARIDTLDYLILSLRFKKLWIQKSENVMWFINILVAILSIIVSSLVALELSKSNEPIKIEKEQFEILKQALKNKKVDIPEVKKNNELPKKVQNNNLDYHSKPRSLRYPQR
jgi:hypothetical protein